MRVDTLLLLAAATLLVTTGTAVGADNTAPLANAGVDQTVPVNSTVYLDASGSTDPDGEITSVAWSIETPSGETISPACDDCRRTEFDANSTGQYAVTLTVTDDDGATRSDTLYVTSTNESGPAVSLSGPTSTLAGSNATLTANVSADRASLQTLAWLVNGSVVERASLNGSSANHSFSHSFDSTVPVRVVVYDTLGERGSATRRMSVHTGGSVISGCGDQLCGDGSDKIYTDDGTTYIVDTNNRDGIQLHGGSGDNSLRDYGDNLVESGDLVKTEGGAYKVTGGRSLSEVTKETHETDAPMNEDESNSGDILGGGVPGDSDGIPGNINEIVDGMFGGDSDGGKTNSNGGNSGDGGDDNDGYRDGIMF